MDRRPKRRRSCITPSRRSAATGARLIQRAGRGIRLTPEGKLLAQRATEILGRVDAASVELAARVGLRTGRVRLAGFQTVLSTLVPRAAAELSRSHPGIELNLVDAHPVEGLQMLRSGHVDIALIFRHADTPLEEEGFRLTHLLDDPIYLVSYQPHQRLEDHRDSAWVGGCGRRPGAGGRRDGCRHPQRTRVAGSPGAGHPHHTAHRQHPPDIRRHVRRPAGPTRHNRADRDPDITAPGTEPGRGGRADAGQSIQHECGSALRGDRRGRT